MLDLLDKLRQKPEGSRFRIAITVAGLLTAVIFVLWFSVLSVRFTDSGTLGSADSSKVASPISAFGSNIGQFFFTISDAFKEFRQSISTVEYDASSTYQQP